MTLTRTATLRLLRTVGIALLSLIIISYAIWRSFNYARGPAIEITQPLNGASTSSSTIEITGRALRVNSLYINGNAISVDQQGNFDETLVVFPGLNIITFAAKDQFKRSTQKELQIVGLTTQQ